MARSWQSLRISERKDFSAIFPAERRSTSTRSSPCTGRSWSISWNTMRRPCWKSWRRRTLQCIRTGRAALRTEWAGADRIRWQIFFKNFSKTHQNKIYLQERLPISITVRESFCSYFYYASFSFARAASVAKPSLSFTASSASIFLLISTFASFNPCMNLL